MKMMMILSAADFRVPVLSFAETLKDGAFNLAVFPFNVTPDIFMLMIEYFSMKGTMN